MAPHPEKESYHGGVFGPEGGVISPLAYFLGIVLLVGPPRIKLISFITILNIM